MDPLRFHCSRQFLSGKFVFWQGSPRNEVAQCCWVLLSIISVSHFSTDVFVATPRLVPQCARRSWPLQGRGRTSRVPSERRRRLCLLPEALHRSFHPTSTPLPFPSSPFPSRPSFSPFTELFNLFAACSCTVICHHPSPILINKKLYLHNNTYLHISYRLDNYTDCYTPTCLPHDHCNH